MHELNHRKYPRGSNTEWWKVPIKCRANIIVGSATFELFQHSVEWEYSGDIPQKIFAEGENPMLFVLKEKGQGLVEYALILVLVAIVVIAALSILGPRIGSVFSKINSSL